MENLIDLLKLKNKKDIVLKVLKLKDNIDNYNYKYSINNIPPEENKHNFSQILNTRKIPSILNEYIISNRKNPKDKIKFKIYYNTANKKIFLEINNKKLEFSIEEWNNIVPNNHKLLILNENLLYNLKDLKVGNDTPETWKNHPFKNKIKIGYAELIFEDKNGILIKHKIWHHNSLLKINSLFSDVKEFRFYTKDQILKKRQYFNIIQGKLKITENKDLEFYKLIILKIPVWEEKLFTTEKLGLSKNELKELKTNWRKYWEMVLHGYLFKNNQKIFFNNLSKHLNFVKKHLKNKYLQQFYKKYNEYGEKKEEYEIGPGKYIIELEKEEKGEKTSHFFKVQILEENKFKGYLDIKKINDVKINKNIIIYKEIENKTIDGKLYKKKIENKKQFSPKLLDNIRKIEKKQNIKEKHFINDKEAIIILNNKKSYIVDEQNILNLVSYNIKKDKTVIYKTKIQKINKEILKSNKIKEGEIDIKKGIIKFMLNEISEEIKEVSGLDIKGFIENKGDILSESGETLTDILYLMSFEKLNKEYYKIINHTANEILIKDGIKENFAEMKKFFNEGKIKSKKIYEFIDKIDNLIDNTPKIKNSLQNILLTGGIYSLNEILDELIEIFKTYYEKYKEIKENWKNKKKYIKEKITEYVKEKSKEKKEEYEENVENDFLNVEKNIFESIISFIDFIKTSVKDFIERVKKEGLKKVLEDYIKELKEKIDGKLKELWKKIPKNLDELYNLFKNYLIKISNKFIKYLKEFLQKVANSVFTKQMKGELAFFLDKIDEKYNKEKIEEIKYTERFEKINNKIQKKMTEKISLTRKKIILMQFKNAITNDKLLSNFEKDKLIENINLELELLKKETIEIINNKIIAEDEKKEEKQIKYSGFVKTKPRKNREKILDTLSLT